MYNALKTLVGNTMKDNDESLIALITNSDESAPRCVDEALASNSVVQLRKESQYYIQLVLAAIEHHNLPVLAVLLNSTMILELIKGADLALPSLGGHESTLPAGYVCLTNAIKHATDDSEPAIVETLLGFEVFRKHLSIRHLELAKDNPWLLERLLQEPYFQERPGLSLPYQWLAGRHDEVAEYLRNLKEIKTGMLEQALPAMVLDRSHFDKLVEKTIRDANDCMILPAMMLMAIDELNQRQDPKLMQLLLNSSFSFIAFSTLITLIKQQAILDDSGSLKSHHEIPMTICGQFNINLLEQKIFEHINFATVRSKPSQEIINKIFLLLSDESSQLGIDRFVRWLGHFNDLQYNEDVFNSLIKIDRSGSELENIGKLITGLDMPDIVYQSCIQYALENGAFDLAFDCASKCMNGSFVEQFKSVDKRLYSEMIGVMSVLPRLRMFTQAPPTPPAPPAPPSYDEPNVSHGNLEP